MDSQHRHRALTPRSVYLIIQLDDPSWVVTAFRPRPPATGVAWTEEEFRDHGERKLTREANMSRDDLTRLTVEALRRAAQHVPVTVQDVWWLAIAVGYGRVLADDAEVRALLPTAEAAVQSLAPPLRVEIALALDWTGTHQQLAEGIEADRSEDLEEALADAEDLLAVADAIGEDARAEELCAHAAALLVRRPAAWTHVAERAGVLLRRWGGDTRPLVRLWASIAASPDPMLVAGDHSAVSSVQQRWQSRLSRWVTSGADDLRDWGKRTLDSVLVVAPAPAMGPETSSTAPWHLRGAPAGGVHHFHYRVFVVGETHPEGHDVTAQFTLDDGLLWDLEHENDRAAVILVAGTEPIVGRSLDEVLTSAGTRSNVYVGYRELSPPTQ
jgi:hypothetical protein